MSIKPREPSKAIMKRCGRLFEILQYRRPHQSKSEEKCISQFLRCYKGMVEHKGGLIYEVLPDVPAGALQWHSDTMFSCHTDTVHHNGGTQNISFDEEMGLIYKDDKDPLGADDGVGMWLMLEMIDAGVPGTYVFHRGEERGGIGSDWFVDHMPDYFKRFRRAVAFDRRDVKHVITRQRGGECCSDTFAVALAAALNEQVPTFFEYRPDSTGIFTDTASYTHLIPECTNLSVGYEMEHTGSETQDLWHLLRMRDALIGVDWELLPTARTPKKERYSWGGYGFVGSASTKVSTPLSAVPPPAITEVFLMDRAELEYWLYNCPDEASEFLWNLLHEGGEREVEEQEPAAEDIVEIGGERYVDAGNGDLVKVYDRQTPALLTPVRRGTPDDPWDDDVYGYPRDL